MKETNTAEQIEIGATVKRAHSDRWSEGETGQIVEIDVIKGRARVFWTACNNPAVVGWKPKRTWIKLANVQVVCAEAI